MKTILKAAFLPILVCAVLSGSARCEEKNIHYRLQPTDVIMITVHGHADLTTKTRVTADGYISFPLLGKVMAEGLTVIELEQDIKEALEKDFLVEAHVLVFIDQYRLRQVSVMGEVTKPGKFDMPTEKDMTLMEAIAMAGGFTKHANESQTKIMRTEDGKKRIIIVDVRLITEKGRQDVDIVLMPEDIVYVPESFF